MPTTDSASPSMRMKKYCGGHRRLREVSRPLSRAGRQAVHEHARTRSATAGSPDRDRRADSHVLRPDRRPLTSQDRVRQLRISAPDSGLHLAGRQRQHRKLGPRVRLAGARQRLLPDRAVRRTRSASTRPRSPRTRSRAKPTTTSPSCTCRPGATRRPTTRCKSAEKAGYKVHPQLKQDIKAKLAG